MEEIEINTVMVGDYVFVHAPCEDNIKQKYRVRKIIGKSTKKIFELVFDGDGYGIEDAECFIRHNGEYHEVFANEIIKSYKSPNRSSKEKIENIKESLKQLISIKEEIEKQLDELSVI